LELCCEFSRPYQTRTRNDGCLPSELVRSPVHLLQASATSLSLRGNRLLYNFFQGLGLRRVPVFEYQRGSIFWAAPSQGVSPLGPAGNRLLRAHRLVQLDDLLRGYLERAGIRERSRKTRRGLAFQKRTRAFLTPLRFPASSEERRHWLLHCVRWS
jgi:hypothetical protein